MNRRIETALRSKYNFRKRCSAKETNELCAQGYNNFLYCVYRVREKLCVSNAVCVLIHERFLVNWTAYKKFIHALIFEACVKLLSSYAKIIRDTTKAYSSWNKRLPKILCVKNYATNGVICVATYKFLCIHCTRICVIKRSSCIEIWNV